MEAKHTDTKESTGEFYDCLEAYARQHLQTWLQDLLEQEVTDVLGRRKHERKMPGVSKPGIAMSMANPGGLPSVWERWKCAGPWCATSMNDSSPECSPSLHGRVGRSASSYPICICMGWRVGILNWPYGAS